MISIRVGNSYSNITGLSSAQEKELRDRLSYVVGGKFAFYSTFGPRKKSLLDKRGSFPTGLKGRVFEYLSELKITWDNLDNRTHPVLKVGQLMTGYDWQVEAVRMAVAHKRGIISAPTGTGKSRVIAMIASRLNVETLVIVPSLEIKKQLSEGLKALKNVTVMNIDSTGLPNMMDYDCLIIDECHHVAAKTYQKLNKVAWNNIYYRFHLTATPFRNDTEEQLLFESIAGEVIYKLDYQTAIKNNYIVPIEAYYLQLPKQKTDAFTYRQVYDELVIHNETRNLLIASTLLKLEHSGASILCLVREIEHGNILSGMTGLPFISGDDISSREYIREFNSGEVRIVIATTGIMGEGVDTKPCEYVIVAGLGKAKSQFMQQVGRSVRNYPDKESAKVIIFKDSSHKFLLRHYNAQRAILKEEYGVVCHKLETE